jgi:hypothetical protein
LTGGVRKTLEFALKHKKPSLVLAKSELKEDPSLLLGRFIQQNRVHILNVAGPRASDEPSVCDFVIMVLDSWHSRAFGSFGPGALV